MCIAIPYVVVSVDGMVGTVERDGQQKRVDMSLVLDAQPGDTVLVFINQVLRKLDPEEVPAIEAAVRGLAGVLAGTATQADIDAAMMGLGEGEPTLPPHLQALVGKKTVE